MLSDVNPCIPDSVGVLVQYIKSKLKLDIDRHKMRYLRVDPSGDEFIRNQLAATFFYNKDIKINYLTFLLSNIITNIIEYLSPLVISPASNIMLLDTKENTVPSFRDENSVKVKLLELQILISQNRPKLQLLEEPKLKLTQQFSLKIIIFAEKDFNSDVLIVVQTAINMKPLILQTQFQTCAFTMKFILYSFYLHQDNDIRGTILHNLIPQLPKSYLIYDDFNAHNIMWGSSNTNTRGKKRRELH